MYFCAMLKVVLIGTGNVARQLFPALQGSGKAQVVQVAGRNPAALSHFSRHTATGGLDGIDPGADMYIIAVSDDAIPTVSELITDSNKLVIHTSGSVALEALAGPHRKGACYPLQTFSKDREVDFREIPLCIEAENKNDLALLRDLAHALSDMVLEVSSEKRRSLHLAAVFANNFTNHLYHISHELLDREMLPFTLLLPLIRETAAKINQMPPFDAQTGPARRDDQAVIRKHLQLLENQHQREIYALLSNAITDTYAKKL